MPAQIIQMMAFAQIIDIWRPGRSMEDHLKVDFGGFYLHVGMHPLREPSLYSTVGDAADELKIGPTRKAMVLLTIPVN